MTKHTHNPLNDEHFHAVNAVICKQTMAESDFVYSIEMGKAFTIHHGMRYGAPIVIVENHNHEVGELSGVWYCNENN